MQCTICNAEAAEIHPVYGTMPGKRCAKRRSTYSLPDKPVEFVGNDIQSQRTQYGRSIIQPWRGDTLSKEYLDLYGTKGIKVTDKEIKKAKPVWRDLYSANVDLKKTK